MAREIPQLRNSTPKFDVFSLVLGRMPRLKFTKVRQFGVGFGTSCDLLSYPEKESEAKAETFPDFGTVYIAVDSFLSEDYGMCEMTIRECVKSLRDVDISRLGAQLYKNIPSQSRSVQKPFHHREFKCQDEHEY